MYHWRYGPAPYNKIQSKKLQYKSQMTPRGPKSEFIEKKYNKSISKVTMAIRRQTMNFFQSNDHWSAVVMYKSFIALHKNLYLPLTILHMQRKTLSFE